MSQKQEMNQSSESQGALMLWNACKNGGLDVIIQLLDKGVNIEGEHVTSCGISPLVTCCKEGRVSCGIMLLDRGANIEGVCENYMGYEGAYTALIMACWYKQSIASLLLDRGAKLDAKCEGNIGLYSPLFTACYAGNISAALMLIARGADPTAKNDHNESAFEAFIEISDKHNAVILMDAARSEYLFSKGWSHLLSVAWIGDLPSCLRRISAETPFTQHVHNAFGHHPFCHPTMSDDAMREGIVAMGDLVWARRRPLLSVLIGSGIMLPTSQFEQLSIDTSIHLDGVILDTPKKKWQHLLAQVFSDLGIVRAIASYL